MSDIKERLDILRGNIQEEDFLLGKGLSNEVIFVCFVTMLRMK